MTAARERSRARDSHSELGGLADRLVVPAVAAADHGSAAAFGSGRAGARAEAGVAPAVLGRRTVGIGGAGVGLHGRARARVVRVEALTARETALQALVAGREATPHRAGVEEGVGLDEPIANEGIRRVHKAVDRRVAHRVGVSRAGVQQLMRVAATEQRHTRETRA